MTKVFVDNDDVFRHYEPMAAKPPRPTEAELRILQVLWEGGPRSVRDVQGILNGVRPTGYTTVLKMLQIMTEKGLVDRDESVRPQIYRAKYSQEHTQRRLLGDLLNRAFGGSVRALVLQALSTKKSTPEELEAIGRLLDRIEGGAK
jgi:predicted transcriptional regulator